MEQETIFHLGLFFIGVSLFCGFLLLPFRSNPFWQLQSFLIVTGFIFLAFGSAFIYEFYYNNFSGLASPKHLFDEALSNIYRNKIILGFAIFGVCLAIWARIVGQRQLEKSIQMNRNDRFAKAAEMLGNIDNKISSRGGLYVLRNLADEDPKTEYIRCVEIISHWLIDDGEKVQNYKSEVIKDNLLDIAVGIFRIKIDGKIQNKIRKYMKDNDWDFWPILEHADLRGTDLRGANLQSADLQDADLRGANLQGAKLENADISNANMNDVKNLTKEQILSAKWFKDRQEKLLRKRNTVILEDPPELPKDLLNDSEVQEWLKNPAKNPAKGL